MTPLEAVLLAAVTLSWIAVTVYRAQAILNKLENTQNDNWQPPKT